MEDAAGYRSDQKTERRNGRIMRRNRRKRRIIRLGVLAVLVLAVLAVLLLFRVRKVNVYGSERHSAGEISSGLMHNMLTKNTLYLQWEYRNGEVPDTLPFLSALKVTMKSPFEIDVEVTEKELAGYVDKGSYAYFDEDGVVQEITGEVYDGLPVVTGADIGEPVLYQKLPTASSAQLRTILSVTQLLRYQGLSAQEIRFGENGEITVYVNRVEAMLGQDEYLEEKIANLRAILERTGNEAGTLHMESFTGKNEAATFRPSDEPVTEAETGDGADAGAGAQTDPAADSGNLAGLGAPDTDSDTAGGDGTDTQDPAGTAETDASQSTSNTIPMVFNSSGTLVYNVHIENGVVVDSYGNPVPGCSVDANGNVVDAYMNVLDPQTGELVQ